MLRFPRLTLLITPWLLLACTAQPKATLQLPPLTAPATDGVSATWWTRYQEPALDDLITQAFQANPDVRLALSRVAEARAGQHAALGRLLPQVGVGVGRSDRRTDLDDLFKRGLPDVEADRVSAELSWEVDLLGAARAGRRAALNDLRAAEHGVIGARLLVSSEVARLWFQSKALATQSRLLQELVTASETRHRLLMQRVQAGISSPQDAEQALADWQNVAAELPALETQRIAVQTRLGALLGMTPEAARALPQPTTDWPTVSPVAPGQPAELLARRPDLVAAEHQLMAANERLREARRSLLPRFMLSALGGVQDLVINGVAAPGVRFQEASALFSLPLFTGGQLWARVDAQQAREQQALIRYEQQVLQALGEVETALADHRAQITGRERRQRAAEAQARVLTHSSAQKSAGVLSELQWLGALRAERLAQQQLTNSHLNEVLSDIQLHLALGGGWQAAPNTRPLPQLITPLGAQP